MAKFKKYYLFWVFSFVFISAKAFEKNIPLGGRAAGMAGASVSHSDIWSVCSNQAGLGGIDRFTMAVYNEQRILNELGTKALICGIPFKSGTFGISVASSGLNIAGLQRFGLAFGKKLSHNFMAGLQMNYIRIIQPENYGNDGAINCEVGIIANPVEKLFIGFHVFNPIRAKFFHQPDDKLFTLIRAGAEYHFIDIFQMSCELEKYLDAPLNIKIGGDYNFCKNLSLRFGMGTQPVLYSFGMGFNFHKFIADVAFSFHNTLGLIPHLSFSYAF